MKQPIKNKLPINNLVLFCHRIKILARKFSVKLGAVVEWSLLTPEVRGSNPAICKICIEFFLLTNVLKRLN